MIQSRNSYADLTTGMVSLMTARGALKRSIGNEADKLIELLEVTDSEQFKLWWERASNGINSQTAAQLKVHAA